MQIEFKDPATLKPYPNNSRKHSDAQIDRIANSIDAFGFTNPVLIDIKNNIVAGHARVVAAQRLKLKSVPTLVLTNLTADEIKAYVIADNKLAELSEWDYDILTEELRTLHSVDFDLSLLGFDSDTLKNLLGAIDEIAMPALSDGPRNELRQITFTLTAQQLERVQNALDLADQRLLDYQFKDGNTNRNGNLITFICEQYK